MDASHEICGRSPAADAFVNRLRCLTQAELAALVREVGQVRATAADDLDWSKASAAVSAELHRLHRSRAAAVASLHAGEAVLAAPGAPAVPHDRLVRVARAAEDVARSLVAGGPPSALAVLGRGWQDLVGPGSPPSWPTAA